MLHLERTRRPTQTDGVLYMPSGRAFKTLERPWKNNVPFTSCVPDGMYKITPWRSPRHGDCYILEGEGVGHTKGWRTHILLHPANSIAELQGCVALGLGWRGDRLRDSRAAMELFLYDMAGKSAMLYIATIDYKEE